MIVPRFEIRHFRVRKACAKVFCLFVHVQDELRTINSIGKARVIFDQGGRGKLAAGLSPFEHERIQIRTRSVNRRRQSGAAAPDNDHFLHE